MRKLPAPCCLFWFVCVVVGQQDSSLPPPLTVHVSMEQAWNAMEGVLTEQKYSISNQDRTQGRILTDFREYMSGPLTDSYLNKIGQAGRLPDGDWVQAEYQYEVNFEFLGAQETMVTVDANIRGLKRDFFGTETWVSIPSTGNREEELLTRFGRSLFGQAFKLKEPKKGFWKQSPQPVVDPEQRIPKVAGPERP